MTRAPTSLAHPHITSPQLCYDTNRKRELGDEPHFAYEYVLPTTATGTSTTLKNSFPYPIPCHNTGYPPSFKQGSSSLGQIERPHQKPQQYRKRNSPPATPSHLPKSRPYNTHTPAPLDPPAPQPASTSPNTTSLLRIQRKRDPDEKKKALHPAPCTCRVVSARGKRKSQKSFQHGADGTKSTIVIR